MSPAVERTYRSTGYQRVNPQADERGEGRHRGLSSPISRRPSISGMALVDDPERS